MTSIREQFRRQAQACATLGSPFMGQLMTLVADRLTGGDPISDRILAWPGDTGPNAQSVPLRLAGALHALRLENGAMAEVYPPNQPSDDALWEAVQATLLRDAAYIDAFLNSPPQTNEIRRSAVLIPAAHEVAARFALPIRLSELGASGGLNLMWDQFKLDEMGPPDSPIELTPDWQGDRPTLSAPKVVERRGVDLNPLAADDIRLRAYLWPDQPDRLARTEAAIRLRNAPVDRGDAIDWLSPRLTHVPGRCHLIQHTIAWQYFPAEKQTQGRALIEAAGATATADHPLAWVAMENDGGPKGAAVTLRLWPGDLTLDLGRADFHGRWVDWRTPER